VITTCLKLRRIY